MAKKKKSKTTSKSAKAARPAAPTIEGKSAEPAPKKKRTDPFTFLQQVRAEAAKVTWTSRNETLVSTIMVLIMVAIMAAFFFFVDQGLRFTVCTVLPIDCVSDVGDL